mmetsp:Transcript_42414/g.113166  ORF Transcript_42414/g.113166 Transcript_42414/m.113166 type:complete len:751 (-) Transcript_42414:49-2301(-)
MLTPAFAPSLPPICIPRVRPHPNQNSRPGPHLLASPRPLPSPLSHTWDLMIAFILIITVFSNPLSMAFEPLSKRLFVFNVITDFIFCADVAKHLNTGYLNDNGFAVMDRRKVTVTYLTGWFLGDLLSSIPIDLMIGSDEGTGNRASSALRASEVLKLMKLMRLSKILRVFRLSRVQTYLAVVRTSVEDHLKIQIPEGMVAVWNLFLYLLLLVHWTGCINFMVAWIYDFPEGSWVAEANLVDKPVGTQYSWCFFKGLSQMIGLGFEIPPLVNTSCITPDFWCTVEHWMSLACLYVGAGFYALLISNVSFIVQNISRGKVRCAGQPSPATHYPRHRGPLTLHVCTYVTCTRHSQINLREMVISVNEYMRAKHIPAPIREKVRSFFKIKFGATGGKLYDEAEILSELTPNLREEIIYYNQRELFQLVPLFKRGPSSFSHKLAPRLKGRVHFAAEFIFEEESHGDEIFFISSGICEIISCYSETVVKLIADGYYFGDVGCLMQCPRTAGVRAKVSTTLYSLSREDLDCVLDDHPHMHKYMILIAQRRRLRLAFLNPENGMTTLNAESMRDDEDSRTEYFAKVQSMQAQEALVENEATRIGKQRSTLIGLRETFKNGLSAKNFSGIAGSDGVKENGEATDAEPAEPASPTFGRMGNLGNLWTRSISSRGAGLNLKNSLSVAMGGSSPTNRTNGTNAGSQVRPVFDGRNNGQRNDPKGLRKGLVKAQSQRPTRNPDAASTVRRKESFRKRSASDGL